MLGKYYNPTGQFSHNMLNKAKSSPSNYIKNKRIIQQQRKQFQRRIFGQHYNYSKVGLNKEKKYLIEQQKNTEIQRANRILLQKIRKIGQRSIYPSPKSKVYTQQYDQDTHMITKTTKLNQFYSRKETPLKQSQKQSQNRQFTPAQFQSTSRSPNMQRHILFHAFLITIYIQAGKYTIYSQQPNMQHKIQMNLDNYKTLLRQTLHGDHTNIFNLLQYNGTLLELVGAKRQQVSIVEQEQFALPSLSSFFHSKQRVDTN